MDSCAICGLFIFVIGILVLVIIIKRHNDKTLQNSIIEKQSQYIRQQQTVQQQPIKEVYIKEVYNVVKIKCPYCGTLNEINDNKCSTCGAAVGSK